MGDVDMNELRERWGDDVRVPVGGGEYVGPGWRRVPAGVVGAHSGQIVGPHDDRAYDAWCRAKALELAIARVEGAPMNDGLLLYLADVFHRYIDEGGMP